MELLDVSQQNLPFYLPWCPKAVSPGITLHADRLASSNPFAKELPFDLQSWYYSKFRIFPSDSGSFISTSVAARRKEAEQLSFAVGAEVDCYIARANVNAQYSKDMSQDTSNIQASITSRHEYATVLFNQAPKLSLDALATLKDPGAKRKGLDAFRTRFGDYYVAGFRIGGEAGLALSKSSTTAKAKEMLTLRAEAEFLCFSKTYERNETTSNRATYASDTTLSGFDTLTYYKFPPDSSTQPPTIREREARKIGQMIRCLPFRIQERVARTLKNSESTFGLDVCRKLCEAGLVTELILLPVSTLREVIEWAVDTDII